MTRLLFVGLSLRLRAALARLMEWLYEVVLYRIRIVDCGAGYWCGEPCDGGYGYVGDFVGESCGCFGWNRFGVIGWVYCDLLFGVLCRFRVSFSGCDD